MKILVFVLSPLVLASSFALGQPPVNPMSKGLEFLVRDFAKNVFEAAKEMPEKDYDWRPAPEARTFGEIVAHLVDANRNFCAAASGRAEPLDPRAERGTRKTPQSKAALIAQVRESLDGCHKLFETLDDERLASPVDFGGGQLIDGRPIPESQLATGTVLAILAVHTSLHYGNLTTYLRLKGLVPPTSRDIPK